MPAMSRRSLLFALWTAMVGLSAPASAQAPEKLTIVIFGPPSLGAFLPPVIKAQKFDEQNGLDITFEERTPDAYSMQFNSAEFLVGGSASLIQVGLADLRGVKITYLFNLFDYFGAVVTSRPEIQSVKDLAGKDLAAARGTTNYVMFDWFARRLGVDTSKMSVVNTATPGLIGYALADRAAAVQLWEPGYTFLLAKKPDIRTLDLSLDATWKAFTGRSIQPYLGVAAHQSWIETHKELVPRLYATYRAAAAWVTADPEKAAAIIGAKASEPEQAALAGLIKSNDRLRLNIQPAAGIRNDIEAVYRAGVEIGYLNRMPSVSSIYSSPLQ
jgi:ABC-type nitrate/sulfonate/bicarbonate transport system substrate-binding protein